MKLVLNQQTLQYEPEKRKSIQIPIGRYFKPLNQSSANGMTICIGSDYKTQIMIDKTDYNRILLMVGQKGHFYERFQVDRLEDLEKVFAKVEISEDFKNELKEIMIFIFRQVPSF